MNEQKIFIEEASMRLALIQPAYNEIYPDASKSDDYNRITVKDAIASYAIPQKAYVDITSSIKVPELTLQQVN